MRFVAHSLIGIHPTLLEDIRSFKKPIITYPVAMRQNNRLNQFSLSSNKPGASAMKP